MHDPSSSWLNKIGRAGYAAKAATYSVIAVLAGKAALGQGGETTGSKGAIEEIGSKPFGQVILVLLIVGFLCYAVWRIISACNSEEKIPKRIGYFVSALIHLGLAFGAYSALTFSRAGSGGGDDSSAQEGTAKLMAMPFGPWLVMGVGVAVIFAAFAQWRSAMKGSFKRNFDLEGAATGHREKIMTIARTGLAARGVVFALIGVFLLQAGWQADSAEARGLGGTLRELERQPFGPWLLGLAALGLLCYAVYCATVARYGELGR